MSNLMRVSSVHLPTAPEFPVDHCYLTTIPSANNGVCLRLSFQCRLHHLLFFFLDQIFIKKKVSKAVFRVFHAMWFCFVFFAEQ